MKKNYFTVTAHLIIIREKLNTFQMRNFKTAYNSKFHIFLIILLL